ncbi:MAG: hypothetical protein MUE41_01550 [Gemmatimonadaceae bacterium]|jgi:hypothetical protein|nr:hypothetical protein [Gemmatimonadaceae bacterium]
MANEQGWSGGDTKGTSNATEDRTARTIGIGCFTTVIGGVSGGMIGVLIGKAVGMANRCVPIEGLPACDWHVYAGWGILTGALTLPVLTLWRLRRSDRR